MQPMAVFSDPQMGERTMTPEARKILEERAAQWRAKVAANPELAKVTLRAAEERLKSEEEAQRRTKTDQE